MVWSGTPDNTLQQDIGHFYLLSHLSKVGQVGAGLYSYSKNDIKNKKYLL